LIVCNQPINYKLFKGFSEFKCGTTYLFDKNVIDVKDKDFAFIKLNGVNVLILKNEGERFMDINANWVFISNNDVGIEWYDDHEHNLDTKIYDGKCNIKF
jgi:hypothetical protein